jgi:hypothetical protein
MAPQLPRIGLNPQAAMPDFLPISLSDALAEGGCLRENAHAGVNSPNRMSSFAFIEVLP